MTIDPNGWVRHLIIGIILFLIGIKTNKINFLFFICCFFAITKEVLDTFVFMGSLYLKNSIPDILYTIIPFLMFYLRENIINKIKII